MIIDLMVFFLRQKTAYELRISDLISDVCSSDLIEVERLQIVTRAFDIGEILPGPILEVGDPERLFVGEAPDFDEVADVRIIIGPQPGDGPVAPRTRDDLIIMVRVAGHTADDRGKLLLALRDDGFNEIGAAVFVESTKSEEHTSELQSLMRISYAVFCLK